MVETRNISLGGLLFHVELPAYTVLRDYLSDLRQVLRGAEGREEVLQEVEHRLAELFTEFTAGTRSVVTLVDVEKAKTQLGEPKAFRELTDEEEPEKKKNQQGDQKRRVFRDSDDSVIAGVAAGLAHRVGVDPILVRALFILLLIGPGIGPLLYAILWAITPRAKSASDRLAMKGDPVTLDAIKQTVEDQLNKAKDEFENPESGRRLLAWWRRFISDTLPRFLRAFIRTLGWFLIGASLLLLLLIGALVLSGLITGHWNFQFMF